MGRSIRSAGLLAALAVTVPGAAVAQQPAPPSAQPTPAPSAQPDMTQLVQKIDQASPASAPAAGSTGAAAPAPSGAGAPVAGAKSNGDVTGYGYSDKPVRSAPSAPTHARRRLPKLLHHANEVVASFPGFEMLADGGSRLFVQLSKSVDVDQAKSSDSTPRPMRKGKHARANAKPAAGGAGSTLAVTMRGAEVLSRVNELALETVHFNTPVVSARLVPAGNDLQFVIHLRADVAPTVKVVPTKDNGAMVQIDFPAGSYLPPAEAMEAARGAAPASMQAQPDTLAPEGVNNSASETE
jgi:hypothetical protein